GRVNVKVGPLRMAYKGEARITEMDEARRRLVIEAAGREARGSGTARATVTATLKQAGEGTRVGLATELALTGRPAQLGRGLVGEVGGKIIGQFAERLSLEMRSDRTGDGQTLTDAPEPTWSGREGEKRRDGAPRESAAAPTASPAGAAARAEDNSLDVFSLLGPEARKRGLLAAAAVALLLVAFMFGRRRGPGRGTDGERR